MHLDAYEVVATVEKVYIDFYMDLLGFQTKHINYSNGAVNNEEDFYELEFTNMIFILQSATQQKLIKYSEAIELANEVREQILQIKNER